MNWLGVQHGSEHSTYHATSSSIKYTTKSEVFPNADEQKLFLSQKKTLKSASIS